MSKMRVDVVMVQRGLAESRSLAQKLVMAGQVRVNGQVAAKPSDLVNSDVLIEIEHGPDFVSRGGEKLLAALESFAIDIQGLVCADVGASTGGFTDCLLQHGARKVYAIDVGYGVLHWKLRKHPRVVSMERTNARFVRVLPEPVSFISIDVSFISLKIILPVIQGWFLPEDGEAVALIKPQFEAGREEAQRGEGVIHDPLVHRRVLADVLSFAQQEGFSIKGLILSPLRGPKGNIEFLAYLSTRSNSVAVDVENAIQKVTLTDPPAG